MEIAPAGASVSFEVTFSSPDLFVGMTVYNTSGVNPVLVAGPIAMINAQANTYIANFTPLANISYLVIKSIYTDDTFTNLDLTEPASSETVYGANLGGSGGGGSGGGTLVGYVIPNPTIVGLIKC